MMYMYVTLFLQSVFNGMHVIFIPYSVMKNDPASWMKMVTRFKGMFHSVVNLLFCSVPLCTYSFYVHRGVL